MSQSYLLYLQDHTLGARILLRSSLETIALLIHLNQLIEEVLNGTLNFHKFSDKTSLLLLGSRNKTTKHSSINVVTILEKCNQQYDNISSIYADLSECAHPNFEGTCFGYSTPNTDSHTTEFSNKWVQMYSEVHLKSMLLFMEVFEHEYNEVWIKRIRELEGWVEEIGRAHV